MRMPNRGKISDLKTDKNKPKQDTPDIRYVKAFNMLYGRDGIAKDEKEGEQELIKLAKENFIKAQLELARQYEGGIGTILKKNKERAFQYYLKAANQGNAESQMWVGRKYRHGDEGVAQNDKAAFEWFTKAANQGHAAAFYPLGTCYEQGWGVKKDQELALIWLTKSGILSALGYDSYYDEDFLLKKALSSNHPHAVRELVNYYLDKSHYGRALFFLVIEALIHPKESDRNVILNEINKLSPKLDKDLLKLAKFYYQLVKDLTANKIIITEAQLANPIQFIKSQLGNYDPTPAGKSAEARSGADEKTPLMAGGQKELDRDKVRKEIEKRIDQSLTQLKKVDKSIKKLVEDLEKSSEASYQRVRLFPASAPASASAAASVNYAGKVLDEKSSATEKTKKGKTV